MTIRPFLWSYRVCCATIVLLVLLHHCDDQAHAAETHRPAYPIRLVNRRAEEVQLTIFFWTDGSGTLHNGARTWSQVPGKRLLVGADRQPVDVSSFSYIVRDKATGAWFKRGTALGNKPAEITDGAFEIVVTANDDAGHRVKVQNKSDRAVQLIINNFHDFKHERKKGGAWNISPGKSTGLSLNSKAFHALDVDYQIKDSASGIVVKAGRSAEPVIALEASEVTKKLAVEKPSTARNTSRPSPSTAGRQRSSSVPKTASRYTARRQKLPSRPSSPGSQQKSDGTITGSRGGDVALGLGAAYFAWLAKSQADKAEAKNANREDIKKNGYRPGAVVKSSRGGYWWGGWEGLVVEQVNDRVFRVKVSRAHPDSKYSGDRIYEFVDSEIQPF